MDARAGSLWHKTAGEATLWKSPRNRVENPGLILTRVVDVEIIVFASAVQCLLIDRSQHGRLVSVQHKCSHQHRIIPGCTLGALDGDGGRKVWRLNIL